MPFHQFGGKVTPQLKELYSRSAHWKNGRFENLQETRLSVPFRDFPKILFQQFTDRLKKQPKQPIPILSFDKAKFLDPDPGARFSWYGHSAILMHMCGKTLFIDPMLGPDASPIVPVQTKRFSQGTLDLVDDFPEIDLLLLTHDHYDHLDYASIQRLKTKTKRYAVALGMKRHLVKWGVDPTCIDEYDWWQVRELGDIKITFTPTRHFSGRGLTDRSRSLWGGWVFQSPIESIWFSGDGGDGDHFSQIGKHFGGFDLAFMECGQYNEHWHQLHLFPEEAVAASQRALAKKIMPVHWGGFSLAPHPWKEPVEIFTRKALELQLDYLVPPLGQIVRLAENPKENWWDDF